MIKLSDLTPQTSLIRKINSFASKQNLEAYFDSRDSRECFLVYAEDAPKEVVDEIRSSVESFAKQYGLNLNYHPNSISFKPEAAQ